MSSVYLKISSLLIRTLSKPIANSIKAQAREHEGFRKVCISFAQSMHRLDMRLRLGLLQDQAAIDRQLAKEAKEAAAKRAKTDSGAAKADESGAAGSEKADSAQQKKPSRPKIRPLSDAKAIDSGANFISESFLFSVGLGLIVFETWRSRRKENNRRSDVDDKIADLEAQNRALVDKLEGVNAELLRLKPASLDDAAAQNQAPGKRDADGASKESNDKKKAGSMVSA